MRFRKLRIAFSATCLIACVLLLMLWVRSYWRLDVLRLRTRKSEVIDVSSERGIIRVGGNANPLSLFPQCSIVSFPTNYQYPILRFGFGYYTLTPFAIVVTVPDWFAILFCAILAATPWFRWPRRFSLRTLLIATTLVAVVLGLICYAAR